MRKIALFIFLVVVLLLVMAILGCHNQYNPESIKSATGIVMQIQKDNDKTYVRLRFEDAVKFRGTINYTDEWFEVGDSIKIGQILKLR